MNKYRNYLLMLLMVIQAFNYVDRIALGVLLQNIKTDLALSDTQLGFLTGIAFALFYAILGIPIARWADRGNRVTIISLTAGLWSAAVALCGMTTNFVQLMLARVGVGVGEAGCVPPALSLISDYFPRAERPRALSRYMLGGPLAMVIGNFGAGWLNEVYGWRSTFVILGMPGLVLAGLAAFALKEPRRMKFDLPEASPQRSGPEPSLKDVVVTLWTNKALLNLLFSLSAWGFFAFGIATWQPAFFVRSYHLATGELGVWLAIIGGVGGFLGAWLGGELASRYASNNERLQLLAIAVAYSTLAILGVGVFWVSDYHVAFGLMAISTFTLNSTNGTLFAATQTLAPPHMRAMSMALIGFTTSLLGMGLGPLAVGALSDALRPWFGEESLRYALMAMSPGYLWCAWHLWRASRTVTGDVAAVELQQNSAVAEAGASR